MKKGFIIHFKGKVEIESETKSGAKNMFKYGLGLENIPSMQLKITQVRVRK